MTPKPKPRRWMQWVLEESRAPLPAMPWARRHRRRAAAE
jgi:hypothetical protein